MRHDPNKLTYKQALFLEKYLETRDPKVAAKLAGYSAANAHTIGHRLLTHPGIRSILDKQQKEIVAKTGIDAAWVLNELRRVAEQEDVAQTTKVRALELIAKHFGMLTENIHLKTDGLTSEQRAERVAILLERVKSRD